MSSTALGRVLVVDDEFQLMDALVDSLSFQGYEAQGVSSALDAIEALQKQEFDLLLTDLMMPGMDGITLLKACAAIDPHLVGILMTGQGTVQTAVEAMKTGAFDYVLKPFRMDALLPVLARAREVQRLRLENIQLRETVAIYDLSQTIAFSLDAKLVLEKTLDAALQQTNAEEGSIMLLMPELDELQIAAARGQGRAQLLGQRIPLTTGIAGWVARQSEPLILNGEVTDDRFVSLWPQPEIHSAISMPMLTAGKLIGILNVNSLQARRPFTAGQVKALSILTSTAAAALDNEALYSALEASQKRFQSLIEHAPDGIALLGLDGKLQQVTPSTEQILGYTLEDAREQDPSQLTHPDDLPMLLGQLSDLIQNPGRVIRTEYRFRHKNGSWRWLESTVSNMINQPSVQAILFNYRDITERKQAEANLHESERQMSALVTSLDDIVFEFDEHGTYLNVWAADESMLVRPKDRLLRRRISEVLGEESGRPFMDAIQRVISSGRSEDIEYSLDVVSGKHWFVAKISPIRGPDGSYRHASMLIRDITSRKQAEEALRESETRYRLATRATNDVIWEWTPKTKQLTWSENAQHVLGYSSEEIRDETWWDTHIHPEDQKHVISKMNEIVAGTETIWSGEYRFLLKDGSYAYISDHGYVERDTNGEAIRMIGAMSDITKRKRAEEQIQLQIKRLRSLHSIDVAISSSYNLDLTLDILLSQVITQLSVDAAAILLFQPASRTLVYGGGRGFRTPDIRGARVRLGEGYAGKAVMERRTIHDPNLMENAGELPANFVSMLKEEHFVDYYCVPLIVKGYVKGALEIFHRSTLESDPEWLDFLETLAGQAAIAIEDSTLFENLQRSNQDLFQAYDATIEGWSHALDLRDKETEGHTQRVTELTTELARKFGFNGEQLINIRWGALLHDIGKMGVPDNILLKPDKLTDEEWEIMKKHPTFAYEMLSPIAYLKSSLDIPYCHHEKWDGSGYPRGLKREVIPLVARLFAVVDVWDALRSDRPYRKGWTAEETIEYIRAQAGSHFDPNVVEHFLQILKQ